MSWLFSVYSFLALYSFHFNSDNTGGPTNETTEGKETSNNTNILFQLFFHLFPRAGAVGILLVMSLIIMTSPEAAICRCSSKKVF